MLLFVIFSRFQEGYLPGCAPRWQGSPKGSFSAEGVQWSFDKEEECNTKNLYDSIFHIFLSHTNLRTPYTNNAILHHYFCASTNPFKAHRPIFATNHQLLQLFLTFHTNVFLWQWHMRSIYLPSPRLRTRYLNITKKFFRSAGAVFWRAGTLQTS